MVPAWSYPAPGPAGRTTALPLRLRIPPFSLSLAWVTPGETAETNPSVRTKELQPGSRSLLQVGVLSQGVLCCGSLRVSSFLPLSSVLPPSLPLLPLIRPAAARPGAQSRCSSRCYRGAYRRGRGAAMTALPLSMLSAARSRCI